MCEGLREAQIFAYQRMQSARRCAKGEAKRSLLHIVWRLCEVGVLEARSFNLAQMYVKSTNVEVGAEAPISQNRCYLLPFFSFRHSLLFLMLVSKLKILRFLLIMRKVKLQILSC